MNGCTGAKDVGALGLLHQSLTLAAQGDWRLAWADPRCNHRDAEKQITERTEKEQTK